MRRGRSRCHPECVALRCLIVDDNERFLEAASSSLDSTTIDVVGVATAASDAEALVDELRPDVVLVDISLGDESGFELTRRLVEGRPWLHDRVVLISTRAEDDYSDLIAESPAVGFLSKSQLTATAVRELVAGPA
jgi:DNA-binding NarL/FixJ family response regulator